LHQNSVNPEIQRILDRALDGYDTNREQALRLMNVDETSPAMHALISTANVLTRKQFGNRGEVYGTIGMNLWSCPKSCEFCSFGADWNLIETRAELGREEIVTAAKSLEDNGVNAIFMMTTADYPIDRYINFARAVRKAVSAKMPLVANIGDFGPKRAKDLVEAGFQAVYHVLRLREGKDTRIFPKQRLETINVAREAGLDLSYCVEPIGPEHSPEELVAEMFRGKQLGAVNLACMWRVAVPGLPLSRFGMISELTLAKAVAVTRIVAGNSIKAMGVHEPGMDPLLSGANQIYAKTTGFSPRRENNPNHIVQNSQFRNGFSPDQCRNLLREAGYTPLEGPSRVFQGNGH
jgi:biotin synthase